MKQAVSIRSERPEDAPEVARLLKAAFAQDPHSDGRESELVEALRRSDDYLPRLALTAENEAGVAGFLMMTRGFVPGEGAEALPILILAPLAVTPEAQGRGIGSALVAEALLRARAAGEAGVALLGDPGYYGRFGFEPAADFGLRFPFDAPERYCLALALSPAFGRCARGVVKFSDAFGLNS